jgi:hypothetical protein
LYELRENFDELRGVEGSLNLTTPADKGESEQNTSIYLNKIEKLNICSGFLYMFVNVYVHNCQTKVSK